FQAEDGIRDKLVTGVQTCALPISASSSSRSGRSRRSRSLPSVLPLLEGRAYVVTGASRGIGHAIASRLSALGAGVLAVSRGVSRSERASCRERGESQVGEVAFNKR